MALVWTDWQQPNDRTILNTFMRRGWLQSSGGSAGAVQSGGGVVWENASYVTGGDTDMRVAYNPIDPNPYSARQQVNWYPLETLMGKSTIGVTPPDVWVEREYEAETGTALEVRFHGLMWKASSTMSAAAKLYLLDAAAHATGDPSGASFTTDWLTPANLAGGAVAHSWGDVQETDVAFTTAWSAYTDDLLLTSLAFDEYVAGWSADPGGLDVVGWTQTTAGVATHGDLMVDLKYRPPRVRYLVDTGAWPLKVVSADAAQIWRVGPTENPDGGILRLVEADGTVWVQDTAGTRPLTVVDADGTVLETLPMSLETP